MKRFRSSATGLLLALGVAPALFARAGAPPLLAAMPEAYKNASAPAPAPASPAPVDGGGSDWWTLFGDKRLDALEEQARRSNPHLAQALARVVVAREETRAAAAGFFPQVRLDLNASRTRSTNTAATQRAELAGDGAAAGFGAPAGAGGAPPVFSSQPLSNRFNDFGTSFVAGYEIDVFGRVRHAVAGAWAETRAAEADRRAVGLSLGAEVASAYFTLRAYDSEIAALRETVTLRRDAVQLNAERVKAGVASELDLARSQMALADTEADLQEALRLRAGLENSLAALVGEAASGFRVAARPLRETPLPAIPAGIPSALLERRPDLAEARHRLAAAGERIGVARAGMLPRFNIEGRSGFESGTGDRLFETQSRALAVMGSVSIPIFEGGRNLANLRAARARREEALAAYRETALTALKEVENALGDLRCRAGQAQARARSEEEARKVVELARKQYIEGKTSYFEVVDAQRSLLNARLARIQTLNARFQATIALARALGGGWGAL